MKRFPLYLVIIAVISLISVACNDKDSSSQDEPLNHTAYNVIVSSFSLGANEDVLVGLDSVFFTIDLDNALIFNADSLPKGTSVRKLVLSIGLPEVSKADITMPDSHGVDTIVNYLSSPGDSINFSRGFVKLHVVSANTEVERTYTVKVNVHKLNPDSLSWGASAWAQLPTNLSAPTATKTIEQNGKVLCFSVEGASVCKAECDNIQSSDWTYTAVSLPDNADINTLTAADTQLYLCTYDGKLYSSTDGGSTWNDTGTEMNTIYGNYQGTIVGARKASDGSYFHTTYPASTETPVDVKMPVSGMSQSILYTSKWSTKPQLIFLGGVAADGTYTGDCWAYDGSQWIKSSVSTPPAAQGYSLIPYFAFKTSTDWTVTEQTVLLAMGGSAGPGILQGKVYISYDRGVHWSLAPDLMQLPANIQIGYLASSLVLNSTLSVPSAWTSVPGHVLPRWYQVQVPQQTRATTAITQWDCPYIYIFGGYGSNDALSTEVFRGVINRLSFKPLQ